MPVCRCGKTIRTGRRCRSCQLEDRGAHTDTADHDCPTCGKPTSAPDVECRHCRRDA